MKVRVTTVLFVLISLTAFGIGVFLLIFADGTPAPGLILMLVSAVVFIRRFFAGTTHVPTSLDDDHQVSKAIRRGRKNYQYDVERRRRGEID